ncbi:Hypp7729 [Branchiostoma lanceolatum]|uniref:Hypp7729 protein n=1 Tax=Branchiostoma lanceolatum TaxID=7740 RepID=A0A8J9Z2I0_BRALA|nr:Hypp7729 [Branchiostoma lanceolatum]
MAGEDTGDPRNLLKLNRPLLIKDIRSTEPILDRLYQFSDITEEEREEIQGKATHQERARTLLDIVATKGKKTYYHFREALKTLYPHLEEILHRCPLHNARLKLYCEVCECLICMDCKDLHRTHAATSVVAVADEARSNFASFVRENRRKLATKHGQEISDLEKKHLGVWVETRAAHLQAQVTRRIEQEKEWFIGKLYQLPGSAISSVAESTNLDRSTSLEETPGDKKEQCWVTGHTLGRVVHSKLCINIGKVAEFIHENPWLPRDDQRLLQRVMTLVLEEPRQIVWYDAEITVHGVKISGLKFTAGNKTNRYFVHLVDVEKPRSICEEKKWRKTQCGDVLIWSEVKK